MQVSTALLYISCPENNYNNECVKIELNEISLYRKTILSRYLSVCTDLFHIPIQVIYFIFNI